MKDFKQRKGRIVTLVLSISLMGILYGWFVNAGEIESDVDSMAKLARPAIDPSVLANRVFQDQTVTNLLNTDTTRAFYSTSQMTPTDAAITIHFGNYCEDGPESGNCPSDPSLTWGDVKLTSILGPTAYTSAGTQAAQNFLRNLLPVSGVNFQTNDNSGSSSGPVSAATVTSDPTLKAKYAAALAQAASASVVNTVFAEMMAKRTVDPNSNTSWMQRMLALVLERAGSLEWANALPGMTPEQLSVEQAKIAATALELSLAQYRQNELTQALLAVLVLSNAQAQSQAQSAIQGQPNAEAIKNAAQSGASGGSSGS
jgi:hypothetical protein